LTNGNPSQKKPPIFTLFSSIIYECCNISKYIQAKIMRDFTITAQWVVLPKKRTSKDKIEHIMGLTLHTKTYYTFLERFFYNKKLFCISESSAIYTASTRFKIV